MRHRPFAVLAGTLLIAAFAPAAAGADTGVGTAPGEEGPSASRLGQRPRRTVKCTERRLCASASVSLQRPARSLMPATVRATVSRWTPARPFTVRFAAQW